MPPHASNTIRTLRVVYLLADRGIQPRGAEGVVPVGCRAEVLAALTDALRLVEPRLG